MFIEDIEGEFKLVAPDVDALLRCFEHHSPLDSTQSTEPLLDAFEKVTDQIDEKRELSDLIYDADKDKDGLLNKQEFK